jgi:hypothetical protein
VAEEIVVKEQLTQEMKEAGDDLTKRLRGDPDFGLLCSLWLYSSEFNRWRLVVGTPVVDTSGPIHAYQMMEGIVGDNWPYPDTPLYEISLLRSNHSLVRALRSLGHFEIQEVFPSHRPSSTSRVQKKISFTPVQDVFIEDALVYYIE